MLRTISLNEAVEKVTEASAGNWDEVAPSTHLGFSKFVKEYLSVTQPPSLFSQQETTTSYEIEEYAGQQLNARLLGPNWGWIAGDNCDPELAHKIRTHLVDHREEQQYFMRHRGTGDTIRAVLSTEYTPFDNLPLVEMIVDAVSTPGVAISNFIAGDMTRGYVLDTQTVIANDPRDPQGRGGGQVHPGFYFSNDEIGRGRARIKPAVFTGYCSNGAILGWQETEGLALVHRWLNTGSMKVLVAQAIAAALALSEAAAQAYLASFETKIGGKSAAVTMIEKLRRRHGFSEEQEVRWIALTDAEVNNRGADVYTLGDIVNGLTVQSHAVDDPIEKQGIEIAAGTILGDLFKKAISKDADLIEVQREFQQARF